MFGYIRPRREELRVREDQYYRAAYCGLCRCLGRRCGPLARFLVSYDVTFLYLLLARQEAEEKPCFCPANPFRRRGCLMPDAAMEYAADVNLLLSYWQLDDARRDSRGLRRLGAALAQRLYRRAARRAALRQPELDALIRRQLEALRALEREHCPSMDRTADAFAVLLQHCADAMLPPQARPEQQLLYHVGRYIYLTDALDDLPKDMKSGAYNPLRYRFSCGEAGLCDADRQYLCRSIDESIGLAATALELTQKQPGRAILENIVYLGMPAVLQAVEQGRFHANRKDRRA